MSSKISYRIWQFWQSFTSSLDENDWREIGLILSPPEIELFQELPVPDQNHSLRVLKTLQDGGEDDPDLLKAALRHDLGKTRHPLKRWERVFAVLVMAFFPSRSKKWGVGQPSGWKRPLVIIQDHPQWGADLARMTDSPDRVIWLIENHEKQNPEGVKSPQDLILLRKLQKADNQN